MAVKIYVANLGKYNEGILQGEWFTLPADMAEVSEAIGLNSQYEEYAIHDYEAPFKIGEYDSIEKLNAVIENIEECSDIEDFYELTAILKDENRKHDINAYAGMAMNVLSNISHEEHGIITDDQLNEMMKNKVLEGAEYGSIKNFLGNADMSNEYHILDGYENVDRLTPNYIQSCIEEALENFRNYHGL